MTNDERDILNGAMRKLPMMPIREMVIFPHMMTPFVVGRESSVRALEEALNGDRRIFLATQHDASVDEPTPDDIYTVGVIGNIVQSVRMPDGNIKVLVEGVERARASEINARNRAIGCAGAPAVRAVWQAAAVAQSRGDCGAAHGRTRKARRRDCGESSAGD